MKKIAVITGDIHHLPDHIKRVFYGTLRFPADHELKAAYKYAKILYELSIPCTLFITGVLVNKFADRIKQLIALKNIEIGPHTYYAFRGPLYGYTTLISAYSKFFGCPYGPKIIIRHDVFRVIHAFRKLGIEPKVWRTHGYCGTTYLYKLLSKLGFKIVSDCISNTFKIFKYYTMVHICINMPTDEILSQLSQHERRIWYQKYMRRLKLKSENKEPLVLQLHPVNMILDNFEFFIDILRLLKRLGYNFMKLSEIPQHLGIRI